jgi:hypothetical protein
LAVRRRLGRSLRRDPPRVVACEHLAANLCPTFARETI